MSDIDFTNLWRPKFTRKAIYMDIFLQSILRFGILLIRKIKSRTEYFLPLVKVKISFVTVTSDEYIILS